MRTKLPRPAKSFSIAILLSVAALCAFLIHADRHLHAASLPHAAAKSSSPMLTAANAKSVYAELPLAFEENVGQSPAQIKYLARGAGYGIFLTPQEAIVTLEQSRKGPPTERLGGMLREPKSKGISILQLQFIGSNDSPQIAGEK